jgi:hypothetical protein
MVDWDSFHEVCLDPNSVLICVHEARYHGQLNPSKGRLGNCSHSMHGCFVLSAARSPRWVLLTRAPGVDDLVIKARRRSF